MFSPCYCLKLNVTVYTGRYYSFIITLDGIEIVKLVFVVMSENDVKPLTRQMNWQKEQNLTPLPRFFLFSLPVIGNVFKPRGNVIIHFEGSKKIAIFRKITA